MTLFTRNSVPLLLTLALASFVTITNGMTLNFWSVWLKRPYRGPECVVEVVGVDLDTKANREFDFWSKPDVMVECKHSRWERNTQIEGNTLNPRFVWKAKIPHKKNRGFVFTVYDVNVIDRNYVIGRAFLPANEAIKLMNAEGGGYRVMSLGEGIGQMKVRISKTPKNLKKEVTKEIEL